MTLDHGEKLLTKMCMCTKHVSVIYSKNTDYPELRTANADKISKRLKDCSMQLRALEQLYKKNCDLWKVVSTMASRFTIYSNKQISYIVYKISSLINKISTLFY